MKTDWRIAMVCLSCSYALCLAAQMDVVIGSSKARYVAGEPVFITVKFLNTGATPFAIIVPSSDACTSETIIGVEGLRRSDRSPCSDQGDSLVFTCYNGPGPQRVDIEPHGAYEMRLLLNRTYDLRQPGKYRTHVHVHLQYADVPVRAPGYIDKTRDDRNDLTIELVEGDVDALRAAFGPVLADLDRQDFRPQWYAQAGVLLALAPRFAESRILAWTDRQDLEVMPALRKLGTKAAIEKLEAIAFEDPDGNQQREWLRQAALEQIRYINEKSLLPKLLAITAQNRVQMIRWNAASAAARIGHGEAVPAIGRMLADPDRVITFAGAEALGDTASPDAVGVLISAIPSAKDANTFSAIVEALARLTHRTTAPDFSDRMAVYRRWNEWWTAHRGSADIYGPDSCGAATPLNRE